MLTLKEIIAENKSAPVVVLFGGNPKRRSEVIHLIAELGEVTVYGTLSENEGIKKLESLEKVDLVLLGGRYDFEQRIRIKKFVEQRFPKAKISEPGIDYSYDSVNIKEDVAKKLNKN